MQVEILGVGFDNLSMTEAVDQAFKLMSQRRCAYVVTPNPEIVWQCRTDKKLQDAISGASLTLPDGIGIIYGASILGTPLKERIPGIDFAKAMLSSMSETNMSVFLLGAKPEIAELAAERLTESFPGLVVAGTHHGYFTDDKAIIEAINKSEPDLLLVCLGSPKQEYWMKKNAKKLNAGLMAGLGGSLDVFSGNVRRAPEAWQNLGLEWLYRLLQEPRRIGRVLKLPLFIFGVLGQRVGQKKDEG